MKLQKHHFTLVEILVVLGIMAMVLNFSLPAFNAMTGGSAAERAAQQLVLAVAQARVEAITSGCKVALLFPDVTNNNILPINRNNSYALAYLQDDDEDKLDFSKVSKSHWQSLPDGAVITAITKKKDSNGETVVTDNGWFSQSGNKTAMKDVLIEISGFQDKADKGNGLTVTAYKTQGAFESAFVYNNSNNIIYPPKSILGLVFYPDGTLSSGLSIYVSPGVVTINGEGDATEVSTSSKEGPNCMIMPSGMGSNAPTGSMRVDINRFTGQSAVVAIEVSPKQN